MLMRVAYAAIFGDIFMRCVYRMRPYEQTQGSVEKVHQKWLKKCREFVSGKHMRLATFNKMCRQIIADFDAIPITNEVKPRVGIVGGSLRIRRSRGRCAGSGRLHALLLLQPDL